MSAGNKAFKYPFNILTTYYIHVLTWNNEQFVQLLVWKHTNSCHNTNLHVCSVVHWAMNSNSCGIFFVWLNRRMFLIEQNIGLSNCTDCSVCFQIIQCFWWLSSVVSRWSTMRYFCWRQCLCTDCAVMLSYKLAYSTAVVELRSSVNMLSENGHANASIHIRKSKAIM